ncbi:MAG: N-acetyltransferase [Saprospiraceae bacterium]|nr:N-acetyltransferase [Saprospiraceae bacterium]
MKELSKISIRLATMEDLPDMVEIYNQAILAGEKTADLSPFKPEGRTQWFDNHKPDKYPILLATLDSKPVGYLSISPYREGREALLKTVELSYYVHSDFHRRGIGRNLLEEGMHKAKALGFETVLCILLCVNEASISLLRKFDFELWAKLPSLANINGQYFDHCYYGKKLNPNK